MQPSSCLGGNRPRLHHRTTCNRLRLHAGTGPEGSPRRIMAIVKANAYGHGAVPIAWHLASLARASTVPSAPAQDWESRDWAWATRRKRCSCGARASPIPIVVILGARSCAGETGIDVVANTPSTVTVHSGERVRLRRSGRRAAPTDASVPVHLKVDTGMGRLGCAPSRAVAIAQGIAASEFLRFDGLCTHFSSAGADQPGAEEFTARQIAIFEEVSRAIEAAGIPLPPRHAANSAGLLTRAADHLDLVRPGLALYGLSPQPELREGLRPALALKTQIIFLKDHPAGSAIGYERTHITHRPTRIATLPVGYHDGYPWRLGGKADVLIRGQRAPVVGRVSMDYLTVDVGGVPGARVGDEVTLLGPGLDARELAERAGTIPYEIFTRLGNRVERVYRGGQERLAGGFAVVRRPRDASADRLRADRPSSVEDAGSVEPPSRR